jgi:endonuclease/exonuclease/phosphatase family metal-dependent hydrolase
LIFCADLNALPLSRVYRRFKDVLRDVQDAAGQAGLRRTYPSLLPLVRIDHIFVSAEVVIEGVIVPWTPLTRRASDHLPLVASVRIP